MNSRRDVFFSYAFRPFFLLEGIFAVVIVILWVMAMRGHPLATLPANTMLWHGHEMLVGFAMATIAGFLFTAVAIVRERERGNERQRDRHAGILP